MNTTEVIIKLLQVALYDKNPQCDFSGIDFNEVYALSKKHSIANIVGFALPKLQISLEDELQKKFDNQINAMLYQYLRQDNEEPLVSAALEKAGIPHISLKGNKMRRFYPQPQFRTSSDIDILFDSEDDKATKVMLDIGYEFHKDQGTTLDFSKLTVIEVELHRFLFDDKLDFHSYFNDVWDRAIPVPGKKYEYELSMEDFYAYMVAHMAKHFSRYGSGIRTVLDLYVFNQNVPENFDRNKANQILKKIGLSGFEQRILDLTKKWFSNQPLTDADEKLTDFISGAGLYGSSQIMHTIDLSRKDNINAEKANRTVRFIFPRFEIMSGQYPVLKKAPVLLPFTWFLRFFRVLNPEKRKIAACSQSEFNKINNDDVSYIKDIMNELHLK